MENDDNMAWNKMVDGFINDKNHVRFVDDTNHENQYSWVTFTWSSPYQSSGKNDFSWELHLSGESIWTISMETKR